MNVIMPKDKRPEWPTPVQAGKYEPALRISSLSRDEKQILWKHLKKSHPTKAKAISEIMDDPIVRSMIDTFDASLVIEKEFVPQCLLTLLE